MPILVLQTQATRRSIWRSRPAIRSSSYGPTESRETVIAIAHRPSTIARLDRLVVLDEGNIVEEGPTPELLAAAAEPMRACGAANRADFWTLSVRRVSPLPDSPA